MPSIDLSKIDRNTWLRDVFPEWGTYLNEEIEETKVPQGKLCMRWLACTGVWTKPLWDFFQVIANHLLEMPMPNNK